MSHEGLGPDMEAIAKQEVASREQPASFQDLLAKVKNEVTGVKEVTNFAEGMKDVAMIQQAVDRVQLMAEQAPEFAKYLARHLEELSHIATKGAEGIDVRSDVHRWEFKTTDILQGNFVENRAGGKEKYVKVPDVGVYSKQRMNMLENLRERILEKAPDSTTRVAGVAALDTIIDRYVGRRATNQDKADVQGFFDAYGRGL